MWIRVGPPPVQKLFVTCVHQITANFSGTWAAVTTEKRPCWGYFHRSLTDVVTLWEEWRLCAYRCVHTLYTSGMHFKPPPEVVQSDLNGVKESLKQQLCRNTSADKTEKLTKHHFPLSFTSFTKQLGLVSSFTSTSLLTFSSFLSAFIRHQISAVFT